MDGRQSKRAKSMKGTSSKRSHEASPSQRIWEEEGEATLIDASHNSYKNRDRKNKKRRRGESTLRRAPSDGSEAEGSRSAADTRQHSIHAHTSADEKERRIAPKKCFKKRKAAVSPSRSESIEEEKVHAEREDVCKNSGVEDHIKDLAASTSAVVQIEALQLENARLQEEIGMKDSVMSLQRDTISAFYGQCTCTICMELVWRPHVLSPCGHMFCARCLVAWFTKPLVNESPLPSDLQGDRREVERREFERRRTLKRVKVCPHCREKVSVAPVEVWLVKGLIDQIDTSMRGGQGNNEHLVQGNESFQGLSLQEQQEAKGLNLPTSKKIWKDIFDERPPDEPMFDEEDRVYRCILCANEVINGVCTQCGYEYSIDGMATGSDLLDEDFSLDSMEELDEEAMAFLHDGNAFIRHGNIEFDEEDYGDSEDSDFEGDYDDFLEGDDGMPIPISTDSDSNDSHSAHAHDDVDDDDDDEDGVQEVDVQGRPVGGIRRPRYVISDSDSEGGIAPRHSPLHITIDGSDNDDEEINDNQSHRTDPSNAGIIDRPSSSRSVPAARRLSFDGDDDNDEEEDDDEEDDDDEEHYYG
ncbi:hypothetical protein CBS101457_004090 [Exobasidium rhododendri]|nr:hypothetical protein CBS101457_004090 [Exobasidium rhododendri]